MASTTSNTTVKVLTVGSALGSIGSLFKKIEAINAKHGKFDLVLCVGDFFGPEASETKTEDGDVAQLLSGRLIAPLPCYIMQGEVAIPQPVIDKFANTGGELCQNVFLLSKSAVLTTAEGLRIACLGGAFKPEIYEGSEMLHGFSSPVFTSQTVSKLLSNTLSTSAPKGSSLASIMSSSSSSTLVDILISHVWPASITELSSVPLPSPDLSELGAPPADEIIKKIKPRYIFSSGGGHPPSFWEREPFVWEGDEARASRFVGLGAFGGAPTTGKKQRWFYAFSIAPQSPSSAAVAQPANATPNPFTEAGHRAHKRPLDSTEGENFRWGNVQQPNKRIRTGEQGKPPPGYKCKRCDSTENEQNLRRDTFVKSVTTVGTQPGHLVRDCPTRHAVGDTGGRKPREGYVCRACGSEDHYIEDCLVVQERRPPGGERRPGKRGPPREIGPDECWFCLSNPNLAKHLIVAIGAECYVTLPKGQLIPTQNAGQYQGGELPHVPGGGHVLIVPIAHFTTLSSIPDDLRKPVVRESDSYKAALRAFYAKHGAIPVFFEVGRVSAKGGHAHIQVIPIPLAMHQDVEKSFVEHGKPHGIEFQTEQVDSPVPGLEAGSYFRVELPDGRRLVHWLQDGIPFGVQFGRQVLASMLKLEARLDWKACLQSEEDDKADVQAFKTAFAPFDPTA
ncbi:nuclear protein [Auriscalpium vulgare]|uniref:Nuclear protein n=1 Tax=Auriscalpium vulgare TaxID=40419 RepID=A0ACB8SBC7_9AGAM|nr:nuclear protein [Auriscalpium vulgare]